MIPLLVGGFKGFGDLLRYGQRLVDWDRPTRQTLGEILTLDEFHHEGGDATSFFELVDGGDVRMTEGGERLRFAGEPSQSIRIVRKLVRKDFECDIAIQLGIARAGLVLIAA